MKKLFYSSLLALSLAATMAPAAEKIKNIAEWDKSLWQSQLQHETPEWFRDAKFGIYFHWGVYSYMGFGEWYSRHMYEEIEKGFGATTRPHHLQRYGSKVQYHNFIPYFTASNFDAKEWAKLFKASGAKFVGPTAEHCDNFSNWDSKVNRYNTVNYGPHRDLVGELSKSIKAQGLKFVTTMHHSWEWGWYNIASGRIDRSNEEFRDLYGEETHPDTFFSFASKNSAYEGGVPAKILRPEYAPSRQFVDTWKAKIFEVVDQYEPDLLWFDSRLFLIPEADRAEMVKYYYDKAAERRQEVVLTYKNVDLPEGSAVIDLERGQMENATDYPWLTDDCIAWNSWCWSDELQLKDANFLVDQLADIVCKNGCLLLNITPTCDGVIPAEQQATLLEVGEWLKVNGEAIYETRPYKIAAEGDTKLKKNVHGGVMARGVVYQSTDYRFTQNGSHLYAIQLGLPEVGEEQVIKSFAGLDVKSVKVLGSKERIAWSVADDGLHLHAPKTLPNSEAVVYKVTLGR